MSTNYGTAAFAFHGKAEDLKAFTAEADRQLASYFNNREAFLTERWTKQWNSCEAAAEITVYYQQFFDDSLDEFLEELDSLAQFNPEVEIAVMVEFSNSVTDGHEYAAFYSPAGSSTIRNPEAGDQGLIFYEGLDGEMDNYGGSDDSHAGFDGWGGPPDDPDDDPPDGPDWIYEWQEHVKIYVKWDEEDW